MNFHFLQKFMHFWANLVTFLKMLFSVKIKFTKKNFLRFFFCLVLNRFEADHIEQVEAVMIQSIFCGVIQF